MEGVWGPFPHSLPIEPTSCGYGFHLPRIWALKASPCPLVVWFGIDSFPLKDTGVQVQKRSLVNGKLSIKDTHAGVSLFREAQWFSGLWDPGVIAGGVGGVGGGGVGLWEALVVVSQIRGFHFKHRRWGFPFSRG